MSDSMILDSQLLIHSHQYGLLSSDLYLTLVHLVPIVACLMVELVAQVEAQLPEYLVVPLQFLMALDRLSNLGLLHALVSNQQLKFQKPDKTSFGKEEIQVLRIDSP